MAILGKELLEKNILGITLARGGSKGIKGKNLALINGKPLIYYTIKALKCSKLSNYIVSTDSHEIKRLPKNIKLAFRLLDQKNFQRSIIFCVGNKARSFRM